MSSQEIKKRVNVTVWAYAYEIKNDPLVPDDIFDKTCLEIDVGIDTGNPGMDAWFREHFQPHTGQWIYKHPHLGLLNATYNRITSHKGQKP